MKDLTQNECSALLGNNYIGRMAYIVKGRAEVIPITYYYDQEHHAIISYSGEGNKIEAMRRNGSVSFQVDEITALDKWQSILLHATFEELSGIDAKHQLHQFAEKVKEVILRKDKTNLRFISEFSSKTENDAAPIVYRLNITEVHGKRRE